MRVKKQDGSVESYINFFLRTEQNNEDNNPDSIRNWVPLKKLGSGISRIEGQTGDIPRRTDVIYSGSKEKCKELFDRLTRALKSGLKYFDVTDE